MQRTLSFAMTNFERFLVWYGLNRLVYEMFRDIALRVYHHSQKTSARRIAEHIRWVMVFERGEDGFKLNNNHVPYLARLVMLRHRQLGGFFKTRGGGHDVDDETLLYECKRIDQAA
ncbi:MAG: hypothetical protein ACYTFA_17305 [Planctomycetota bacterium]|jgi:alanyl-tRNA synthetase